MISWVTAKVLWIACYSYTRIMACYLCLSRKIPFKAKIWCCLLFMQPYFYQQLLSARLETFDKLSTFCSTELKFCCHEGLQIFFIIWVYHVTWFTRVLFFFCKITERKFLITILDPVLSTTDLHMRLATTICALFHHVPPGPRTTSGLTRGEMAFFDNMGFWSRVTNELGQDLGVGFKEGLMSSQRTKLAFFTFLIHIVE